MTHSLTVRHEPDPNADTRVPDPHQDTFSKHTMGFWVYLMTDFLLFATLFITYAVLRRHTFGGPTTHDIINLPISFTETMILLFSSVACGLSILAAVNNQNRRTLTWLFVTFFLGAAFLWIEIAEFTHLFREGHTWKVSAFLSAFFTIIGTHGLHIAFGLLWLAVMVFQLLHYGITVDTFRRLTLFGLFWHFLDLIWIFMFTFVHLIGVI